MVSSDSQKMKKWCYSVKKNGAVVSIDLDKSKNYHHHADPRSEIDKHEDSELMKENGNSYSLEYKKNSSIQSQAALSFSFFFRLHIYDKAEF